MIKSSFESIRLQFISIKKIIITDFMLKYSIHQSNFLPFEEAI
jgi:hypothetical protein